MGLIHSNEDATSFFPMRNQRLSRTFVIGKRAAFPSGPKHEYSSESETKQEGLTMSWGVSLPSSRSRRGWSSQIPQMCHSLLSPQKPPDDLENQKHVNNIARVKHSRWVSPSQADVNAAAEGWKEKLHWLRCGSDASTATSVARRQIWWESIQNGRLRSFSPEPGRIDW